MEAEPAVRNAPPPQAVIRVVNPVTRRLLTSPLASRMPPGMALLECTGRRSGRQLIIPVGIHEVQGGPVVFSTAAWRLNFTGGAPLTVVRGKQRRPGRGVLVEDPEVVADALAIAVERKSGRQLAMRIAPGHQVTREDLIRLGRGMVRLELEG